MVRVVRCSTRMNRCKIIHQWSRDVEAERSYTEDGTKLKKSMSGGKSTRGKTREVNFLRVNLTVAARPLPFKVRGEKKKRTRADDDDSSITKHAEVPRKLQRMQSIGSSLFLDVEPPHSPLPLCAGVGYRKGQGCAKRVRPETRCATTRVVRVARKSASSS